MTQNTRKPLFGHRNGKGALPKAEEVYVQLLRRDTAVLLDLPLWFPDLQHLYGGKPVGFYLQRGQLAMP